MDPKNKKTCIPICISYSYEYRYEICHLVLITRMMLPNCQVYINRYFKYLYVHSCVWYLRTCAGFSYGLWCCGMFVACLVFLFSRIVFGCVILHIPPFFPFNDIISDQYTQCPSWFFIYYDHVSTKFCGQLIDKSRVKHRERQVVSSYVPHIIHTAVRVFFTLKRSFYVSTSSTPSVRAVITWWC